MKHLIVLVLFLSGTSCALAELVDYRLNLAAKEVPKNCSVAGSFCESCSTLVGCVDNGDGTWDKNHLATCKSPAYCVDGVCTSTYDPFCYGTADLAFPCQTVGIFPDPFYCNKFVLCVETTILTHYLNTCEDGYQFNIATGLCDIKLENGECDRSQLPVPLCQNAGDSGALEGKPAMFYLCEQYSSSNGVLYPFLDVCPGGESYVDYTCGGTAVVTSTTPITSS